MADILLNQKYLKVINSDGSIAVNQYFEKARCETIQTIVQGDTIADIPSTGLPELPNTGEWVEKDKLYNYNGITVHCIQEHSRTIYPPEETPALFAVYRTNTDNLDWIAGEKVLIGWKRNYLGIQYEVIQEHITQLTWTPEVTPALWQEVQGEEIPVWVQPTGAHDAYRLGAKVHFPTINDPVYESLIDYNTYSPTVYPAGWKKL